VSPTGDGRSRAKSGPWGGAGSEADEGSELGVTIRRLQPYQAHKTYICPGCNQDITAGTGHVVVVPVSEPDLRRHWHHPCWTHRHRRPGRLR